MTAYTEKRCGISLSALMGFFMLCTLLIFARDVIPWIQKGILLCGKTIIPTLFPCMVACDMLVAGSGMQGSATPLDKACRFLFGVPSCGISAFTLGALCGFPIGTKIAADLYRDGKLNEREVENILSFSNNTGPAFLVAGVGISLFGSVKICILLYVLQLVSALLCGILFSILPHKSPSFPERAVPSKNDGGGFVTAVQKSVLNVLSVCGFVLIFSAICGILSSFIKNRILLAFIYAFLEVGGACASAATLLEPMPLFAILCATVAANFGGLSVHLQAASFLQGVPYSFSRYLSAKFIQAVVAVFLTLLCFPFLGIGP